MQAHGVHHAGTGLGVTPTVAVTLGFPGGRSAQFTASYATASVETFTLTGSQGSVTSTAAFMWGAELAYTVDTGDGPRRRTYPAVDQFAGETRYFVRCVREGLRPEPDGEEGLLDIRVCEAVAASLESGSVQTLAPQQLPRTSFLPPRRKGKQLRNCNHGERYAPHTRTTTPPPHRG
ncbi:hypothetical protein MTQ16_04415 [Corynebacterium bovis]|uniref:Gfo/Idh/MocA family oxidoreductase n=1 Tax=Corynebacterium bovis TaxID=36808 RepID=UPI003139894C